MIEKILKETYVNPKVELTQKEYNDLVALARMKAKKIEERAREIYEKEGVAKIQFTGRFYRKQYGEVESERDEFTVDCAEYEISPGGDYEKTLYIIPQESRKKIAKHVKGFVQDTFVSMYGEHMLNLNEIRRLRHKGERWFRQFAIWTALGWLMAVVMFVAVIFK
jgi:hypothetical protein